MTVYKRKTSNKETKKNEWGKVQEVFTICLVSSFYYFYYPTMTVENQEKPAQSKSDLLIDIIEANGALGEEKIDRQWYRTEEGFAVVADIIIDMLTYFWNTLNQQADSMKTLIFQYSNDGSWLLKAMDELVQKILVINWKFDDHKTTIELIEDVHELLLKYGIDHRQYLPAEPTKEDEK